MKDLRLGPGRGGGAGGVAGLSVDTSVAAGSNSNPSASPTAESAAQRHSGHAVGVGASAALTPLLIPPATSSSSSSWHSFTTVHAGTPGPLAVAGGGRLGSWGMHLPSRVDYVTSLASAVAQGKATLGSGMDEKRMRERIASIGAYDHNGAGTDLAMCSKVVQSGTHILLSMRQRSWADAASKIKFADAARVAAAAAAAAAALRVRKATAAAAARATASAAHAASRSRKPRARSGSRAVHDAGDDDIEVVEEGGSDQDIVILEEDAGLPSSHSASLPDLPPAPSGLLVDVSEALASLDALEEARSSIPLGEEGGGGEAAGYAHGQAHASAEGASADVEGELGAAAARFEERCTEVLVTLLCKATEAEITLADGAQLVPGIVLPTDSGSGEGDAIGVVGGGAGFVPIPSEPHRSAVLARVREWVDLQREVANRYADALDEREAVLAARQAALAAAQAARDVDPSPPAATASKRRAGKAGGARAAAGGSGDQPPQAPAAAVPAAGKKKRKREAGKSADAGAAAAGDEIAVQSPDGEVAEEEEVVEVEEGQEEGPAARRARKERKRKRKEDKLAKRAAKRARKASKAAAAAAAGDVSSDDMEVESGRRDGKGKKKRAGPPPSAQQRAVLSASKSARKDVKAGGIASKGSAAKGKAAAVARRASGGGPPLAGPLRASSSSGSSGTGPSALTPKETEARIKQMDPDTQALLNGGGLTRAQRTVLLATLLAEQTFVGGEEGGFVLPSPPADPAPSKARGRKAKAGKGKPSSSGGGAAAAPRAPAPSTLASFSLSGPLPDLTNLLSVDDDLDVSLGELEE